jgi:hypothetical protein
MAFIFVALNATCMKLSISLGIAIVLAIFGADNSVYAQCDPVLMPDSSQFYLDGSILCSARDGNALYIGGNFLNIGKRTGAFIGADSVYGKPMHLDTWPQVSGIVYASAPDGSGGWIIGGSFSQVGGVTRNNLAQINASGQLTSWNPNANNQVNAIVVSGSTVYVGGSFTNVGGQTRNRIAALDISTGNATTWNPNSSGTIYAMQLNNSTLYVGGSFSTIGGQSRTDIAALDVNTGSANTWNPGTNGIVYAITINGTTAYVGGSFTTLASQSRSKIGAVDINTAVATSWNPNSNNTVYTIYYNGSTIYAGGSFTVIGSQNRTAFAELNTGNAQATAVDLALSASSDIRDMKVFGNTLYIGGTFTSVNTQPKNNIAQINTATYTATAWTANTTGTVYTLQAVTGAVYAGGNFNVLGMKPRTRIAAIDMLADTLKSWQADYPPTSGQVMAICVNTTQVYAGGKFDFYDQNLAYHVNLAAYDKGTGAINTAFLFGVSHTNPVLPAPYISVLAATDTALFAAGYYTVTLPGNANAYNRSKWNVAGMYIDAVIAMNANNYYHMQWKDSLIYTGAEIIGNLGSFDTVNLAATAWTPNADGLVRGFAIRGTDMYVGGDFNNICGSFLPRLAKIKTNTPTANTSWNPYPNSYVRCVATDGTIVYASGHFTVMGNNALSRSYLAAVDANGAATTWAPNPNADTVKTIDIYSDKMYIGGGFTTISGKAETYLAVYKITTPDPEVSITGNLSPCAAITDTFTASTFAQNVTYQWQVNGNNVGTNSTIFIYVPAVGDQVRCIITLSPGACYPVLKDTSNVLTVNPFSTTPVVTITGDTSICPGATAHFTATSNVAGVTYQWKVNGINAGTNSDTFSYLALNNDLVTCVITVPAVGCYTSQKDTSNTLTILIIAPYIVPTVTITPADEYVCQGFHTNITASTNVVGGTFDWIINANNSGVHTNPLSYVPNDGDLVYCVINAPSGGCYTILTAGSDTTTVHVVPPSPAISISGPSTASIGSNVTITATLTNAGPGYNIQWYNNASFVTQTPVPNYNYVKGAGTDNWTATLTNVICLNVSANSNTQVVSVPVNVENVAADNGIQVYPNPFENELYISGLAAGTKLYLYDMKGGLVKEWTATANKTAATYNTQGLAKGLYLLRFVDANGNTVAKLSVTRQ